MEEHAAQNLVKTQESKEDPLVSPKCLATTSKLESNVPEKGENSSVDNPLSDKIPTEDCPMEAESFIEMTISFNGKGYPLPVSLDSTVFELKELVQDITAVRIPNQKLINLKLKSGSPATDETLIEELKVPKSNKLKVMVVGSTDLEIAEMSEPCDMPEVINDLKEDVVPGIIETLENQAKLQSRIANYRIKLLSSMRPGRKLLVLDIDYTIFDHRSVGQNMAELMRPHLHEFLTSAYKDYDLAIWSATSMKWIKQKMKLLGVESNPNFNFVFYLDRSAMIRISGPQYGTVDVKPLAVIWAAFSHYSRENTIMFDDLRRNFLMNPQNGLKIRPFAKAHLNRDKDCELRRLAQYLKDISHLPSLSSLRHSHWETYRKGGYF